MNKEEIEALVEMKRNCLNASVYDDEKRLIKANAITRALMLQQENEELQERIDKAIEYINSYDDDCYTDATLKYKISELNITELLQILKGEWK